MALLDLKTDLKSLKYGNDLPGGGSSGQPYQQVDINTVDSGFNRFRMTKFDDGLVRGGVVGAANASIVDTFRIGKFLTDFPKGPLFIVKQIGLQLSNPQLETKKLRTDNPTTGGGLLRNVGNFALNTANKIVNAVGPTRIYNLGINTLAQVPVNAFGQHFNRHGLLPVQDDQTKYLAVAQNNNNEENNRLTGLKNRFGLGASYDLYKGNIKLRKKEQRTLNVIAATFEGGIPFANSVYNDIQSSRIADYIGGPNSVYGIGRTLISRTPERTNDSLKVDYAKNKNYNAQHIPNVKISGSFDFGVSDKTKSIYSENSFDLIKNVNFNPNSSFLNYTSSANDVNNTKYIAENQEASASAKMRVPSSFVGASKFVNSSLSSTSFPNLTSTDNKPTTLDSKTPFIYALNSTPADPIVTASADLGLTISGSSDIPQDINAIDRSLNQNAVNYSNPTIKTYSELRKAVKTSIVQDTYTVNGIDFEKFATEDVNISRNDPYLLYIGSELVNKFKRINDRNVDNDTLALKFVPLDPFTGKALNTLKFLGYITDYTENYDSTWGNVKYTGRAESFYIFNEFKRTVNVGFNIPCFNAKELEKKHCDMSELASVLAGKYQDNLLLGGIITRLKLGRYINDQPGIITNLTFSPIQDSSWDLDKQLAFYLKVSFGFTLIHSFLPQYGKCGFIDRLPDPVPETLPQDTEEDDDRREDTTSTIVINDINPSRIDNTRNANLEASKQKAEFDKDKVLPQTKEQTEAARKKLNSLKFVN